MVSTKSIKRVLLDTDPLWLYAFENVSITHMKHYHGISTYQVIPKVPVYSKRMRILQRYIVTSPFFS